MISNELIAYGLEKFGVVTRYTGTITTSFLYVSTINGVVIHVLHSHTIETFTNVNNRYIDFTVGSDIYGRYTTTSSSTELW